MNKSLSGNLVAAVLALSVANGTDLRAGDLSEAGALNSVSPVRKSANSALANLPSIIIAEIYVNPPDSKSVPAEFIEVYNPASSRVEVSGWEFSKGIQFTFPPGSFIEPHGVLVIAENPPVVRQQFNVSALGPWTGSLANEGETVELSDASGVAVDSVSYGFGFPWPITGDRPAASLQLLHVDLNHNVAGSWRSAAPTPGLVNFRSPDRIPPQIRRVAHSPRAPSSGQAVSIVAEVADPDGVDSVLLEFQIVEPGKYIRQTDAAFTNNWILFSMSSTGTADAAGFVTYSAQLPPDFQMHRRLVRYRITARDALGNSVRVPYADDASLNFAYFVYDGVPAWSGAVQPGVTPVATFGTNVMNQVPALHLLSDQLDVQRSQFDPVFEKSQFEGAVVVDGLVYDHIRYDVAGENSTYKTGKNKWQLRFNRGNWFAQMDDYGRPLQTKRETLKLSGLTEPWAPWNRGLAGLDEAVIFRLNNLAGVAAPKTTYFQLRVLDEPQEADAADQYRGDLWGLYLAYEYYDQNFKKEHDLPDGNLFKIQGTSGNLRLEAQGAGQPNDLSDLWSFVSPFTGYNATPTPPLEWWRANLELSSYYSWRAVLEALNDSDKRELANVAYFRDPNTGRWSIHSWDSDLLYEQFDRWGPEGVQIGWRSMTEVPIDASGVPVLPGTPSSESSGSGARMVYSEGSSSLEQLRRSLEIPTLKIEFQNRARELQDLLLNRDQAAKLVDEFVSRITAGGPRQPGFVEVDRRRWDYNPANPIPPNTESAQGNFYRSPFPVPNIGLGPYPQPFLRTLASEDFAGQVAWIKDFIAADEHGGARLARLADDPTIPETPTISYVGLAGYPKDSLVFQSTSFRSPQGRSATAVQWRIGEVYDSSVANYAAGTPYRFEIEELWTSEELLASSTRVSIPATYIQAGKTYRVRAKFEDAEGRWSHWSAPVEFQAGATTTGAPSQNLVVSEIMYDPPPHQGIAGEFFEFIELRNVGNFRLDLSGLRFTSGISYTFPNGTTLAPGAYLLLARDAARMELKYPGIVIHGLYAGKLDNSGETLTLVEPNGNVVFSFAYNNRNSWPAEANGAGSSLVLVRADPNVDLSNSGNWIASPTVGGSPGGIDPNMPPGSVEQPQGPMMTVEPTDVTLWSGQSAILSASASGQAPMEWSWQKDGIVISGANADQLVLTNVSPVNSGIYSATVRNAAGSSTSVIAVVRVNATARRLSIAKLPDGSIALVTDDANFVPADLARFEVWASANLTDWNVLPIPLALGNGRIVLRDPDTTASRTRFYRLVEN